MTTATNQSTGFTQTSPALSTILMLLSATCMLGCSNHPELQKLDTVPVEGTIYLDGKPMTLGHGSISVTRVDGEDLGVKCWSASGSIDSKGRYSLHTHLGLDHGYSALLSMKAGVPAGRYRVAVRIWDPNSKNPRHPGEPKWLIPRRYTSASRSGLVLHAVGDPRPGAYDLHLRS